MKKLITTIFIFTASTLFLKAAGCANESVVDKFTYKGVKYELVKERKSWFDAAKCAVERGGRLWAINSQEEQDSVIKFVKTKINTDYTQVPDGGGVAYIWTGANDLKKEGVWVWDEKNDSTGVNFWNGQGEAGDNSGKAVNGAFVNWGGIYTGSAGEPDNYNGNQNAAGVSFGAWPYGKAGEWNDINPTNKLYYVIEYDLVTDVKYDNNLNQGLNLSPNPVKDKLTIVNNNNNNINSIELFNSLGLKVYSLQLNNKKEICLNLSGYEKGIYYVKFKYDTGSEENRKIVID